MKINYSTLKSVCLSPIKAFKGLGDVVETQDGIYIYKITPKAKILGVAHLDTVLDLKHFNKMEIKGDDIVFNAQLDDRLGVYTMLDILPSLGIEFDLLLTEGEESGLSTAAHFETSKDYNWMFSFDRHGEDVVMYQYDDKHIRDLLIHSGLKPGIGSFSDIAFLDHLQIKGFNIGVGYEGEHSKMCYANMSILKRQVKRFLQFYKNNKDTKLAHIPTPKKYPPSIRYNWEDWGEYDNLYCYLCNATKGIHEIDADIYLCDGCFNDAEQCQQCFNVFYNYELTNGLCADCLDLGE